MIAPAAYALGTVPIVEYFALIGVAIGLMAWLRRRRHSGAATVLARLPGACRCGEDVHRTRDTRILAGSPRRRTDPKARESRHAVTQQLADHCERGAEPVGRCFSRATCSREHLSDHFGGTLLVRPDRSPLEIIRPCRVEADFRRPDVRCIELGSHLPRHRREGFEQALLEREHRLGWQRAKHSLNRFGLGSGR